MGAGHKLELAPRQAQRRAHAPIYRVDNGDRVGTARVPGECEILL
jgi:hypothetical protein